MAQVVLPIVFILLFIANGLTGIGVPPLGWLWTTLQFAVVGFLFTWIAMRESPWRSAIAAFVFPISLGATILLWLWTPTGHSTLRSALDEVPIPTHLQLVREQASGNSLCFDSCFAVVREYRRTIPFPETCRAIADAFMAAGYNVRPGPGNSFNAERGGIKAVNVSISFHALEEPSTIHDTESVSFRASSEEMGASLSIGDDPICPK